MGNRIEKAQLEPEVLEVFDTMSEYLLSQKKYINELGDMLENSQAGLCRVKERVSYGRL